MSSDPPMKFNAIQKTLSILDNLQKQVLTQNVFKLLQGELTRNVLQSLSVSSLQLRSLWLKDDFSFKKNICYGWMKETPEDVQELLKSLYGAIDELHVFLKSDKIKRFHCKTKLCASQLTKTLPVLADIVNGVQNAAYKEVTDFLIEKIRWCLLEVLRLSSGGGLEDDEAPRGMFVKIMDDAIALLHQDEEVNMVEFKETVDEVLCQALIISKLSINEDRDEISSCCKNVLLAISEFADSSTPLMKDSFKTEAILGTLESLERKVNTSILRLFLHLASDPNLPLKQLTLKALDKYFKPRRVSDLSADFELLDLYCERIQLIGNFAVACSDDQQNKVKILCCLASVEFCENYFLTAMEAFYLTPSDYNKKGFFKFIVDEYQKEVKEFAGLIDLIVDSENFVQVVLEDLAPVAQDIEESIADNIFNKRDAEIFLSRCIRLVKHMHSVQIETFVANPPITEAVNEFESILKQYQMCLRTNVLNLRSMQEVIVKMESSLFVIHKIACLIASSRNGPFQTPGSPNKRKQAIDATPRSLETPILKPYLMRVGETPRLKSSLYVVTPKKIPMRLCLDTISSSANGISGILDNIEDCLDNFTLDGSTIITNCRTDGDEDDRSPENSLETVSREEAGNSVFDESQIGIDSTMKRMEDFLRLTDRISQLKMV